MCTVPDGSFALRGHSQNQFLLFHSSASLPHLDSHCLLSEASFLLSLGSSTREKESWKVRSRDYSLNKWPEVAYITSVHIPLVRMWSNDHTAPW